MMNRGIARRKVFLAEEDYEVFLQTLRETGKLFGVGSYGAVGWACRAVRLTMESDIKFGKRVERIHALIYQPKT